MNNWSSPSAMGSRCVSGRGGYNSDDITKVEVGGGGGGC